ADGANPYTHVVNGRFKGGYITRNYGKPGNGIDAVQLELAQCTYMDEETFEYQPERAVDVQRVIRALLRACLP
ncbi:MAG: N-formylglutamate amidohydrolase, partial [Pseudomonadota bacterium]|nr:N-formylglutamate amidohydrolase [Pseudomonadota bacterium]